VRSRPKVSGGVTRVTIAHITPVVEGQPEGRPSVAWVSACQSSRLNGQPRSVPSRSHLTSKLPASMRSACSSGWSFSIRLLPGASAMVKVLEDWETNQGARKIEGIA
jgi:hypothetical protein